MTLPSVTSPGQVEGFRPRVAKIRQALEWGVRDGKDIVLVVHSYGGVPGNEAVQGYSKAERQKQGKQGGVSHI